MNFETANTLTKIRKATSTSRTKIKFLTYSTYKKTYLRIIPEDFIGEWGISSDFVEEIDNYFPYNGEKEFLKWLNHETQNIELETEIERWLKLKVFI